jgi:hypothetical protein
MYGADFESIFFISDFKETQKKKNHLGISVQKSSPHPHQVMSSAFAAQDSPFKNQPLYTSQKNLQTEVSLS